MSTCQLHISMVLLCVTQVNVVTLGGGGIMYILFYKNEITCCSTYITFFLADDLPYF